jgi:hypothetical protein
MRGWLFEDVKQATIDSGPIRIAYPLDIPARSRRSMACYAVVNATANFTDIRDEVRDYYDFRSISKSFGYILFTFRGCTIW